MASETSDEITLDPLLDQDIFVFLAESSVALVPIHEIGIHHILSLCYVAEIVKVSLAYASFDEKTMTASRTSENELRPLSSTLPDLATKWESLSEFRRLVCSYTLPFLRKSIILLHTRYGVDFPSSGLSEVEVPELDRLTHLLRLPSVEDVVRGLAFGGPSTMKDTASAWVEHYHSQLDKRPSSHRLRLSHPAIFELVGLPKYFDLLLEETNRRRCPTTGKELSDPSVCLFCGDIFCSQAVCCMKGGKKGGCNLHMEK